MPQTFGIIAPHTTAAYISNWTPRHQSQQCSAKSKLIFNIIVLAVISCGILNQSVKIKFRIIIYLLLINLW